MLGHRPMNSRSLTVTLALFTLACGPEQALEATLAPTSGDAIAEASFDAPAIDEAFTVDGAFLRSPVLDAPQGATRVGLLLQLTDPDAPTPRIEGRSAEGDWVPLEVTWREGGQLVAIRDLDEVAYGAELRIDADAPVGMLTWSAVVPEPELPEEELDDVGASREPLRADIAALGVIPREEWGARATRCTSRDDSKYRMAIHHTVTGAGGDPTSTLRGIQNYHMDSRGWCDVGYHFLVSLDGRVWEGRPIRFLGTHVGNNNTGNIGISFIGCFHSSSCASYPPNVPPDVMVDAAGSVVAGLAGIYGIGVSTSTVKGHRDHSGQTTSCPGDHLHSRLGDIRSGSTAPPDYAAEYVEQTFPLAREPFELAPGEIVEGYLEMRNVGGATWRPGETFLGTTEPRDAASPIAAPDWVSASRAATIDREVPPGATGRFVFRVRAPDVPGDYPQFFNLVQESVAWFGDAGQGGPADDIIQIRVTTLDVEPWVPPMADAGPMSTPDGGPVVPREDAAIGSGADAGPGRPMVESGCGCRVGASSSDSLPLALAVLAVGLGAWRRRRRVVPAPRAR